MSKLQKLGAAAALLAVAVGFDLWGPVRSDLRIFDPAETGALEARMWRAYYERQPMRLFWQLGELLRSQYHLPTLRSHLTALHAAEAAFDFRAGRSRPEYEKVLPGLRRFYDEIRAANRPDFDVERAARLELEWWIVHRERDRFGADALRDSLALLQATIFSLPRERFIEHASLRAEAMLLRDKRAEAGGVSEADWRRIDELLRASWLALWKAVQ